MRDHDEQFVKALKEEMKKNPTRLVSPIVGIPVLSFQQEFDRKHPNYYKYETIGGNHSRIALQELLDEHPSDQRYKSRQVAVYSGLTNDQALKLAARHNQATSFTHAVTTQDKVSRLFQCTIYLFIMNLLYPIGCCLSAKVLTWIPGSKQKD